MPERVAPPSNGATWKVARAWWPWLVVLVLDAKDALEDKTTNSFERLSMSFEGWGLKLSFEKGLLRKERATSVKRPQAGFKPTTRQKMTDSIMNM